MHDEGMQQQRAGSLWGMNLNLLLVLVALVEQRSVVEASRLVGLSASAMSHALARLRRVLADPVLVRTARGMVATPRALELCESIAPALRQVEHVLAQGRSFEPARAQRLVRLYANDLAQLALLPPLLARVQAAAPGIHFAVGAYRDSLAVALAEGKVDLVLGLRRDLPTLRQRVLLRDRYVCVVRRGHPCLRRPWTLEAYAALPHAMVSFRAEARGAMDEVLAARGLTRQVVLAASSTLAALRAVAATDWILTVASRSVAPLASALGLALLEPPVAPQAIELSMAWHERTSSDPVLAWVREQLVELVRAEPAPKLVFAKAVAKRGTGQRAGSK